MHSCFPGDAALPHSDGGLLTEVLMEVHLDVDCIVNPRKLEHGFRMISARMHCVCFTLRA